jgi:hypothetical protein
MQRHGASSSSTHRFCSTPSCWRTTSSCPQPRLGSARDGRLSWTLQAAMEAEAAAARDCSGHGRVYLDGVAGENGRPGCECNRCFDGPDCSRRTPDCTADAERSCSCACFAFQEPLRQNPRSSYVRFVAAAARSRCSWSRTGCATRLTARWWSPGGTA